MFIIKLYTIEYFVFFIIDLPIIIYDKKNILKLTKLIMCLKDYIIFLKHSELFV